MDLSKLLAGGERLTLECKKASKSVPGSFWDTYSAFANTSGGVILLGVRENMAEKVRDKRFEVVGVEDADKIRKDLWNIINSREKVSANLLRDEDVQAMTIGGKDIVSVTVPRANYAQRPVYINNNLLKGTFKRNHEGDYHCTEQEIKMMLRDANEIGNDGLLMEHYTMDDVDVPSLNRYRKMFQTLHPEHHWNTCGNKEFLEYVGGYMIDRRSGDEGLTMAGLLMFGKGLPVRERFDNLRMDYIDKSNLIGDQRYSDRLTYDGTWENNLFNFIRMVMPKLISNLPHPFNMNGVVRNDDSLQAKAVREAVTNMIIHSDFLVNGLLRIEKFDDSFVLTNPGLLKLPKEQIYKGGESKARNQRMQNMFRMIGYGENLGSGFPLILSAWDEKHWLRPELIEQPELMQVKLVLKIQNESVNEPVNEPVSEPVSERQKLLLMAMLQNPSINRAKLAKLANVSLATLKRDITALRNSGVITRKGSDKTGIWVIVKNK